MEVNYLRFIHEAIWDRIVSYSGGYLAGLLLVSLIIASLGGGGDNTLLNKLLLTYSPLTVLTIPAAYIVAKKKGLLQ